MDTERKRYHCTYMSRVFTEPFENIVSDAREALANVEYDTMIGRGLSGALVIPRLAEALGKEWMIVRKPGDSSHSTRPAEGVLGRRWLFVDDFISSGETYREVCKAVRKVAEDFETEHVGLWCYEYEYDSYEPADTRTNMIRRGEDKPPHPPKLTVVPPTNDIFTEMPANLLTFYPLSEKM